MFVCRRYVRAITVITTAIPHSNHIYSIIDVGGFVRWTVCVCGVVLVFEIDVFRFVCRTARHNRFVWFCLYTVGRSMCVWVARSLFIEFIPNLDGSVCVSCVLLPMQLWINNHQSGTLRLHIFTFKRHLFVSCRVSGVDAVLPLYQMQNYQQPATQNLPDFVVFTTKK